MKKHLRAMLEALINDETDEAAKELHAYLSSKTRGIILGEEKDEDDSDDSDDEDKDDDKKEEKEEKEDKKDDDDKDEVDEGLEKIAGSKDHTPVHQGGADDKGKQYHGYRHNEKGEAYHKVPHKDDSEGYGYEKVKKAARKGLKDIPGGNRSGANEGMKNAYKDKGHSSDNSHGAKSEDKGSKLKTASQGTSSPDSDGKKENRRTDKAKGYHGKSRDGKDLG